MTVPGLSGIASVRVFGERSLRIVHGYEILACKNGMPVDWVPSRKPDAGKTGQAFCTLTTMLCRPVAPLGWGRVMVDVCTVPVVSTARTETMLLPSGMSGR